MSQESVLNIKIELDQTEPSEDDEFPEVLDEEPEEKEEDPDADPDAPPPIPPFNPPIVEKYWLKLRQAPIPQLRKAAGLPDVYSMIKLARSGLSAKNFKLPKGIEIQGNTITISLDFSATYYPDSLQFTLKAKGPTPSATITGGGKASKSKTLTKVVPMSNHLELDYMGTLTETVWESDCYDVNGVTGPPAVSFSKGYLLFSKTVFGILRVTIADGNEKGYTAKFTFEKTTKGKDLLRMAAKDASKVSSFKNVSVAVEGTFKNKDGTSGIVILNLKIPPYMLDFLEECPDEDLMWAPCDRFTDKDGFSEYRTIYYSTCTGEVLDTIVEKVNNPCN